MASYKYESFEPATIDVVVGTNIRTARESAGLTMEDFVDALRVWGIAWSSVTLGTIEHGKRQLRVNELVGVCAVLQIPPADLVATTEIQVHHGGVWVHPDAYRIALEGRPGDIPFSDQQQQSNFPSHAKDGTPFRWAGNNADLEMIGYMDTDALPDEFYERWCPSLKPNNGSTAPPLHAESQQEATRNAAESLGIGLLETAGMAREVWGRSIREERQERLQELSDKKMNSGARATKAGHITRAMIKELLTHMEQTDLP